MEITVNVRFDVVLPRVKTHLSVIGKRSGKNVSLFSDVTVSQKEMPVLEDLVMSGGENIVSELCDMATSYKTDGGVRFVLRNERWNEYDVSEGSAEWGKNLIEALKSAIERYLLNYCVGCFLTSVYPGLESGGVNYGKAYVDNCGVILGNIKRLAYLKRVVKRALMSYEEAFYGGVEEYDWFLLDESVLDENAVLG